MTKVILAVVNADALDPLLNVLIERKLSVTQISSSGGFRRHGNSTLLISVDDSRVQETLTVIRTACRGLSLSQPDDHAATVFVLDATQIIPIDGALTAEQINQRVF